MKSKYIQKSLDVISKALPFTYSVEIHTLQKALSEANKIKEENNVLKKDIKKLEETRDIAIKYLSQYSDGTYGIWRRKLEKESNIKKPEIRILDCFGGFELVESEQNNE